MNTVRPVAAHFGKVRNSLVLSNGQRILETTDRVSAFDLILPFQVPQKGETLQALSLWFFEQTKHIVQNHVVGALTKNHILVQNALVIPIEFVVRGVLTGSLWRLYKSQGASAVQKIYGVDLPQGLEKNTRLAKPILTPTTKAVSGHDMPLSANDLLPTLEKFLDDKSLAKNLLEEVIAVSLKLFEFGQSLANERGLELVDTKFEFGIVDGKLMLVDEVLTPDSSRYWIKDDTSTQPRQLSKEVLREKLVEKFGDPESFQADLLDRKDFSDTSFTDDVVHSLQSRYEEMFRYFVPTDSPFQVSQKHLVPWPLAPEQVLALVSHLRLPSKILVVGNGGRDWSLFDFLAKQPEVQSIFCAPGKRMWTGSKYKECPHSQPKDIARFAKEQGVELVISGPEVPLASGLVEECREWGVACLGPDLLGVQLEASKILCKNLLNKACVPTAEAQVFAWETLKPLLEKKETNLLPCAIKFDGLASGKGVVVCTAEADLTTALSHFSENVEKWTAQTCLLAADSETKIQQKPMFLIEKLLPGEEISVMALCNGTEFRLLPVARDYKRLFNNQKGPNTGGMGSACPLPLSKDLLAQIHSIFSKTLSTLAEEGRPYFGFLFAGLMVSPGEAPQANVIEFNCRLGDPETQVILPGLGRDFCLELHRTALQLPFAFPLLSGSFFEHDGQKRVYVVAASPEYPQDKITRRQLEVDIPPTGHSTFVPGAIEPDGSTQGGRAFGCLGSAESFAEARRLAYEGLSGCRLREGEVLVAPHFRTDIADELSL